MPIPSTCKIPLPKSDDELEDIVVDALRLRLDNPPPVRFGRSNQNQHGIVGHDATAGASTTLVWQARHRSQVDLGERHLGDLSGHTGHLADVDRLKARSQL